MDQYFKKITDLNLRINQMQKNWVDLKNSLMLLYRENQILKKENQELRGIIKGYKNDTELNQWGKCNLANLYDEGFHICPLCFGEPRKSECLFCQAFFKKAYQEEKSSNDRASIST